jgi:hypothetical protein
MPKNKYAKLPKELLQTHKLSQQQDTYIIWFSCLHVRFNFPRRQLLPKWEKCSKIGVYFGHSAQNASTVSLILNLRTGYVLPQFYCVYDDMFDVLAKDKNFYASWAVNAGLQEKEKEEVEEKEKDTFGNLIDTASQQTIPEIVFIPFDTQESNQTHNPVFKNKEQETLDDFP